jgi:hypothetical protein
MGTSPVLVFDNIVDDSFIHHCLTENHCNGVGLISTKGFYHSAGYLHWRALLTWIGLKDNETFLLLLGLTALGVMLAAQVALRLQGLGAAVVTALILVCASNAAMQLNIITDLTPMLFLGDLFLATAAAAAFRPRLLTTALLGLVGAVAADFYATGALCGVSAALVALSTGRRRGWHVLVAVASFATAAFAMTPASWLVNWDKKVNSAWGAAPPSLMPFSTAPRLLAAVTVVFAGVVVASPALRRRLYVPAAVFLPVSLSVLVMSVHARQYPQPR